MMADDTKRYYLAENIPVFKQIAEDEFKILNAIGRKWLAEYGFKEEFNFLPLDFPLDEFPIFHVVKEFVAPLKIMLQAEVINIGQYFFVSLLEFFTIHSCSEVGGQAVRIVAHSGS
jgi:hypothetical protein